MLLNGPHTVIVTEKDAARIPNAPENVLALAIRLEEWAHTNASQSHRSKV
jgi:hypothetical protein